MRHAPFILVVAPLLLACNAVPESLDGGRPDTPPLLTARIDGTAFTADTNLTRAFRSGSQWVVNGGQVSGPRPRLLTLFFDSLRVGETRPLQSLGSTYAEPRPNGFYLLDSVSGGTLRITRYDPFNRRIAGTFEYVARLYVFDQTGRRVATDTLVDIRDGVFDVDVETSAGIVR